MVVVCPGCNRRLRLKKASSRELLVANCPHCQKKFKIRKKSFSLKVLVAHEDRAICQQITERITLLGGEAVACPSGEDVLQHFSTELSCVVLLDVAFNGVFPFQLIESIKTAGKQQHKVILLSSVYNRTAYKKRPESLYGADAYLELHHIGDRLVPLLGELYPAVAEAITNISPVEIAGGERCLAADDVATQADRLAKLLVADILLYHGDRLEQGMSAGHLEQMFAEQLAEGRRMLHKRLPATANLDTDFVQLAFEAVCQSYSHT